VNTIHRVWSYHSDTCVVEQKGSDSGARPVVADRTCSVIKIPLWMLSGYDLTPRCSASDRFLIESGHILTTQAIN
jgi:hypothetical protein